VNAPLRRAGVVILVMFGMLFANLNWVQAYRADKYRTSDYNGRVQVSEYERPRGVIEADGKGLAESKATDGRLKYLRVYPQKAPFAHVLGFKPVNLGAAGIERSENDFLAGTSDKLFADRISDMFTGDTTSGGNVALTLKIKAQETAWRELNNNRKGVPRGAAIAMNPSTGAIQALVSMPSFDPNPLVSHDTDAALAAYKKLEGATNGPLKNRALSEVLPPGSTFKIVVAAAALENGYTQQTMIPAGSFYTPPTSGSAIKNASPLICPQAKVTPDRGRRPGHRDDQGQAPDGRGP
jgi:peptidoglycan glycosyltransferase